MKTKTINLYTIEELKKEDEKSYDKAIQYFRDSNDYIFLSDRMNEELHELLQYHGIVDTNDTSKPGTSPTQVLYSLSYCQGDGAMFDGGYIYTYNGKKYVITVKYDGSYSNSKSFYTHDEDGNEVDNWEEVETAFNVVYQDICEELERYGYDFMEYEDSEESIKENCKANEYYFTIDGVLA